MTAESLGMVKCYCECHKDGNEDCQNCCVKTERERWEKLIWDVIYTADDQYFKAAERDDFYAREYWKGRRQAGKHILHELAEKKTMVFNLLPLCDKRSMVPAVCECEKPKKECDMADGPCACGKFHRR